MYILSSKSGDFRNIKKKSILRWENVKIYVAILKFQVF